MRRVLITLAVLATLALPATARADQPIVTTQHVEYAITIPADENPCGFDLVFTGLGDVAVTTFSDGRQTSHGILQHTISSLWHTLSSIGPASVHTDLSTGISTDTGMEFSFHLPGAGVVFAQAGNFIFLPDGTVIEHGLDRFDPALCVALAP
jgi:hypothetical protein